MDGVQEDERLTDTRGPGESVEMDGEKNHLRNKVCCNPDAILWQFPYPFVVDVFWDEFFRQAGEQLWYECYSRQDDNFSDRQQIKEGLTLQSIKFGGWQRGWMPGFYYGVCVVCFWRLWPHLCIRIIPVCFCSKYYSGKTIIKLMRKVTSRHGRGCRVAFTVDYIMFFYCKVKASHNDAKLIQFLIKQ